MKYVSISLTILLTALSAVGNGVRTQSVVALSVPELFKGFSFVNQRRFASQTIPPKSGLHHSTTVSHSVPPSFRAGQQYIFHCHAAISTDSVYHLLERRLQDAGFETGAAGERHGERLHPSVLFFKGGGYSGLISLYPTHFSGRVANTQRANLWDIVVFVSAAPAGQGRTEQIVGPEPPPASFSSN